MFNLKSFAQIFSSEEQKEIDSLNSIVVNKISHDTALAGAYLGLSEILAAVNMDTVQPLCEKTKKIVENALTKNPSEKVKLSLYKSLAGAYNNIGFIYKNKGENTQALSNYINSIKLQKLIDDKQGLAISYNNIGVIYDNQGNIEQAIESYHKSLKIREELNDQKGIANTLVNIGFIYGHQGDIKKAVECYQKSLKIYQQINDKSGEARCLNNLGYIYDEQNNTELALAYYEKGLNIREELGDKNGIAFSLNNIGSLYSEQGNIEKAKEYFTKSLKLYQEIGYIQGITMGLHNTGGVYFAKGNIAKAKEATLQSLYLAKKSAFPENIRRAALLLSQIYEKENKGIQALEMYKLHIQMRDSINNESTQKASAQQQAKYEYEKQKAIDDAEHGKQIAIEQEAKVKQKIITYATAGGLGLVVIFLIFVFNRLQITKKQKLVIEHQKLEVENQKKIVENAHQLLEEKNSEILASIRYAKRIQDSLLTSQKYIARNINRLKSLSNKEG